MLENYFVKPQTCDRVRACWIGGEIERYVEWLSAREYADAHGVASGADPGGVRGVRSRSWRG